MKAKLLLFFLLVLPGTPAFSSPTVPARKCHIDDSANYQIGGDVAKYVKAAIEGDLRAAQAIVSYFRSVSEHAKADSTVGCQFRVWKEIAAANGDGQSAYELAIGADRNDWYSCGRSKYWASFFYQAIYRAAKE
ncbi:hypothetical protein [Agrilutibacter solisilvae]|uniref:Uncharacterized protein n=1 Tax=Agrilutibacter solisilvae TaxID=2763317 RepID=A0A974Y321_9GAMM|nr:hypothetical protein [Lysobacter solisilvae]QSX79728.1 hypothetical protein I8J32_007795 [Lysobacter solisilvae]